MHGTDMRAARERATQTENEQSPDLPFELLSQQCLLQTRASAEQVLLTGSKRTEGGKAGEKQNKQKPKQTNHTKASGISWLLPSQSAIQFLLLQKPQQ